MLNKLTPRTDRHKPRRPPLIIPTLRDQSLHFANRNPAKSMKTGHEKKFNRYKNRLSRNRVSRFGFQGLSRRFGMQTLSLKRTSVNSVTLWLAISIQTQKREEKATRNNPTFKNRRNYLRTKEKTFSNRNKIACSGSPVLRQRRRNYHGEDWEIWMAQPPVVPEVGQGWSARGV